MNMLRNDNDTWPPDAPTGTFDIETHGTEGYPKSNAHIVFVCPNGRRCSVLLGEAFVDRPDKDALCIWKWDGDMSQPTLTPSINCVESKDGKPTGGCGWHGHIIKGVMK